MTRRRLDVDLVRRGLARSREHAQDLIHAGRVLVGGVVARKPATQVDADLAVTVTPPRDDPEYVSRGAYKLAGALDRFAAAGLRVEDRDCLDAGASTGGFTDVLLRRGARHVLAVDVGYGQLAWRLRTDPRVTVWERVNVRDLPIADLPYRPGVVVADLSFISLALVLPALTAAAAPDADLVLLVKPQFEVGRGQVGSGGVVRDPDLRAAAVRRIADVAWDLGWGTAGVTASPLPGPRGNVEYLLWLRRDAPVPAPAAIAAAVAAGPEGEATGPEGDAASSPSQAAGPQSAPSPPAVAPGTTGCRP